MEAYFGINEGKCKVKVQVKLQNIRGEGPEFPRIIIPIGISGEASKEGLVYTLMTIQGDVIIRGHGIQFTIANFSENATLKVETETKEVIEDDKPKIALDEPSGLLTPTYEDTHEPLSPEPIISSEADSRYCGL